MLSLQHILLSLTGIFCGAVLAIPGGIFISRHPRWGSPLIQLTGMLYTIPSLALLGLLIPFLGLGWTPTIVALTLYSLLPLLRNTYVGIAEVDVFAKEAAIGMGATDRQLFVQVEWPLALPFIMAGLRTVTVMTIGIATLGALVGAGGLGVLIFRGLHMMDNSLLVAGTLPVALMAVTADNLLEWFETKMRSRLGAVETDRV
jgi:osmoprotectant transport system permease protein